MPFTNVRAVVDKAPRWEKRNTYTLTEVHWLGQVSYTLSIPLKL